MRFALLGNVTDDVLTRFRDHTVVVTDHPNDASVAERAVEAKMTVVRQAAAWQTMDHPLSQQATRMNDNGETTTYNRNGGYVRDARLPEHVDGIIVGSGLSARRLEILREAAEAADIPLRYVVPPKTERYEVELVLSSLGFEDAEPPY